jgi:hypothetical protein
MLTRLALALLGVYVAVVAAAVHRHRAELVGVDWPWGLVLALGASVVVAVAAGRLVRLGSAWFTLGWAVVLVGQSLAPGGSYFVAGDALGYTYTALGLGSLTLIVIRDSRTPR